jgi:hypothetical protein
MFHRLQQIAINAEADFSSDLKQKMDLLNMIVLTAKPDAIHAKVSYHVMVVWPDFTSKIIIAIDVSMDVRYVLHNSPVPKQIQDSLCKKMVMLPVVIKAVLLVMLT